jgi:RHS repeat-associated protein
MKHTVCLVTTAYSPYGYAPLSARPQLLGFCGYWRDERMAEYPLGNGYRVFSVGLMRFRSPDVASPFGEGGVNSYAYCNGDPINKLDRTGRAGTGLTALLKTNKLTFKLKPLIKGLKENESFAVLDTSRQQVSKFNITRKVDTFSVTSTQLDELPTGVYLNRKELYIPWREEVRSEAISLSTGFKRITIRPTLSVVNLRGGGAPLAQNNSYSDLPSQIWALRSNAAALANSHNASTSRR